MFFFIEKCQGVPLQEEELDISVRVALNVFNVQNSFCMELSVWLYWKLEMFAGQNCQDQFVFSLEEVTRIKVHTDMATLISQIRDPYKRHVYVSRIQYATYK